jgi:hemerythrin-like domain-containing protein
MELTATGLLRRDHRRLEEILARFERELSDPQGQGLAAVARTFGEIRIELALHFRREEEVFYPAFQTAAAASGFDTSNLRQEHSDVQGVIAALKSLLEARPDAGEPAPSVRAEIASVGWELWNHIHHHMAEEESGLLAFADRVLDSEAQERLARRMIEEA